MRLLKLISLLATVVVLLMVMLNGCGSSKWLTPLEFMFNNPQYKLQVGHKIYDSHATKDELKRLNNCGHVVLVILVNDNPEYEILLKSKWQRIGDTLYEVSYRGG